MIGMLAYSKAGHDKNCIYIIIACEKDFLYLCDGKLKTIEHPKKKNRKHVQIIKKYMNEELIQKFNDKRIVYDEEIKKVIKDYQRLKEESDV